jgi:fructokinase
MSNKPNDGERRLYGAIEGGGTKFICAVGDGDGKILDQIRIETRGPEATLTEVNRYFAAISGKLGTLVAIGIGAFGPLDLNPASETYGHVTTTPKPGWKNFDLVGALTQGTGVPANLDTDVNAAALGEWRWGAGIGLDSLAYVTVGTGIGVGIAHHGQAVHGLMHPEVGHILVRRHSADAGFAGTCPYHGDCLEGLACGAAVVARTGRTLQDASPNDPIWSIEADYLGQLCANLALNHSPQRIIIGGGVMQPRLYGAVHARMLHWLNGYLGAKALHSADFVTPPGLGGLSGILGSLYLAINAHNPGSPG